MPPFTRTRQPSHEEKKRWPSNHPTPMPEPRRKGSGRRVKTSNIPSIASALHASPAPAVWDEATRSRCSSLGEKLASSLALVDMVHRRQLPPSRVHYQPARLCLLTGVTASSCFLGVIATLTCFNIHTISKLLSSPLLLRPRVPLELALCSSWSLNTIPAYHEPQQHVASSPRPLLTAH